MNNLDDELYMLVGIFLILFLFFILIGITCFFKEFSRELKCINCEIYRSTGEERRYWIKQRRRLWLSLIPFVKY